MKCLLADDSHRKCQALSTLKIKKKNKKKLLFAAVPIGSIICFFYFHCSDLQYIEYIQIFGMNMPFISSIEEKEWRSHE